MTLSRNAAILISALPKFQTAINIRKSSAQVSKIIVQTKACDIEGSAAVVRVE
jgi:hypothetical protein